MKLRPRLMRIWAIVAVICSGNVVSGQVTANSLITKFPTAKWVFPADGAAAINAPLYQVQSLNTDTSGRVIFADPGNHVVLRINSDNTISIIAGNGLEGFSGDGGPARSASLNRPSDAVMDSAGNLYIYDEFNHRIREVTADGVIKTILGNGFNGETGNGGPALDATVGSGDRLAVDSSNNLYISNQCQIRRITKDGVIAVFAGTTGCGHGGDGLPALQVSMNPFGMTFDKQGDLYFTEPAQNYLRKIGTNGIVSTIAGGADTPYPHSVVVDSTGNIFFSVVNSYVIRRVTPGGTNSIVAGLSGQSGYAGDGGPAAQATLFFPLGLALDGSDNLYVADSGNFRIRRIQGGNIETIAGNGHFRSVPDGTPASQAFLFGPDDLTFDQSGNLLVSEVSFSKIAQIQAADNTFDILAGIGVSGWGLLNGPATRALIEYPRQLATDAQGAIYFTDNGAAIVYKLSRDGTLHQVAGNHYVYTYTGDNGPAANATFIHVYGIAIDSSGAVFVSDVAANVVRRIGTNGVITRYAGTGTPGFSGDHGPASAAQLNAPWGIAIDLNGNLLICDSGNNRIRKVDPSGTITTLAGNGIAASSGDGKPASQAAVNAPFGIAVDVDGGVFVLTSGARTLRRVDVKGVISTVAGDGVTLINQGDGGPAGKALLDINGVAVDTFGNVFLTSFDDDSLRIILNYEPHLFLAQPSFEELPTSKFFLAAVSGGAPTAPLSFSVNGDISGVLFSLTADKPWIVLANSQGTTPATVSFTADPSKLAPGEYSGHISLTRIGASQPFAKVAVVFNVVAKLPPQLAVQPSSLSFSTAIGAAVQPSQTVHILNTGSGSLDYQITRAGTVNYILGTNLTGNVTAGSPVASAISVNPANVTPGTFTETLVIKSMATGQSINLPIAISVASKPQRMVLSQRGLSFEAVQGGGITPPQTFSVLNAGGGTFDWTATAKVIGNAPAWLSVTPLEGASTAGSPPPSITVKADPSVLRSPGVYYGLVRLSSAGAANAPQDLEVVLNFLGSDQNVGASVSRSGLIFVAPTGFSSPSSQTISITNLNATPLVVSPQAATLEGIPWLTVVPNAPQQQIAPGGVLTMTLAATVNGLALGAHQGTVLLQFPSPLANLEVNVQFIVTPAGSPGAQVSSLSPNARKAASSAGCTPKKLIPVFSELFNNFTTPAGWPVAMEAKVADDCGAPFTSGQVVVTFSNGDPPLSLVSLNDGSWEGTWYGTNSGSALTIALTADSTTPLLHGVQAYNGHLQANNNNVPAIASGGVQGAANIGAQASIGPGSIVSITGKSFAAVASSAPQLPLPMDLSGSEVVVAGINLPLIYAAGGLINAVVPYDLPPGQFLTIVQRGAAISGPEPIVVGGAQPAIFQVATSTDPQVVQGIWSRLTSGQAIDAASIPPKNPLTAGDVLTIYCTGLGPVSPAIDPTQPAPSPAPTVSNPVTLTIGNTKIPVSSASLVPGYAGIYAVQAKIPSGLTSGDGIPLIISVQNQSSIPVTVSLR